MKGLPSGFNPGVAPGGNPVILQDGTYSYVYGHSVISQTDASGTQTYFLGNGVGSTEVLTDGSGAVIATKKYDVFGAVRSSSGSGSSEYLFTGEQNDSTLGYTYLRARYYDPAVGRFISQDTHPAKVADPNTVNRYVYVGNNPTNLTDPSGQCPWCLAAAAVVAFGLLTPFSLADVGGAFLAATSEGDSEYVPPGSEGSIGGIMITNAGGPAGWISDRFESPSAYTVGHFFFTTEAGLREETKLHELDHVKQYENYGDTFWWNYLTDAERMEREADALAGTCLYGGC